MAKGGFYSVPDLALLELCAIHALTGEWEQAHDYSRHVLDFHQGGALLPMGWTGLY